MRKLWLAAAAALLALPAAAQTQAPGGTGVEQPPGQQQGQQPQQEQQQQMPEQQQPIGQQQQQQEIQGRIAGVDHLKQTITIAPRQGQPVEVQVPETARITLDGVPTQSLGLVREGQFVRASLNQGNVVQQLDVRVRQYSTPE